MGKIYCTIGDGWNGALLSVYRNGQVVLFEVALDDDLANDGTTGILPFEDFPGDDITSVTVTADRPLSADDNLIEGFPFFPNPAENVLNINATAQEVQAILIFNLAGQKVLEQNVNAVSSALEVSRLSTGAFILQVTSSNQTEVYKLIKK